MGILDRSRKGNQNNTRGGVLSRSREEFERREGERYVSQMRAAPDLLNPFKVAENMKERFSPARIEATSQAAADQRQQAAVDSPLGRLVQKGNNLITSAAERVNDLFPGLRDSKANEELGKAVTGAIDHRTNVQRAIANNPVGAFVQGAGDAATLGLTSFGERMLGNPDVADRFTQSAPGKAGQIAGQFVLPAGRLKAGASLLSNVGRGALAGTGLGAGIEAGEYLTGRNDQSLGQRALDVGLSGALGGAGAGAADLIGKGLSRLRNQPPNAPSKRPNALLEAVNEAGNIMTGGLSSGIKRGKTDNLLYSPTLRHIVSGTKKADSSVGAKADQAYIDIVDDIFALSRFDDAAKKAVGRDLTPTESVYQLAMASRGADQITKQSLTNKLVDMQGNVRGDSLKDALQKIKSSDRRIFADYLLNKHAITRFARGEKVFDKLPDGSKWTPEKGQEIVDNYLSLRPEFADAEQAFREFNDNFNQTWLVDSGLLPKNVVDSWKAENPTYIDMRRQFSDMEKIGGAGGSAKTGFGGQKAPSKRYNKYGSTRKVIDPMESMISRYDATVKAAKRNAPMQAMYKILKEQPEALQGLVSVVDNPPPSLNIKDLNLADPDGLEEALRVFDEGYEKALRSSRKDLDNVVPVMVDGTPVYLRFNNKQLLEAVLNVNPQVIKGFMSGAASLANFQKAIYTSVNPIFTLTRSIFRDPISAFVNSKTTNNPFKFAWDLAMATDEVFRNKELFQEFKNIGGGYTSPNVGTPRLLNRTQREIVPNNSRLNGIVQRFGDKMMEGLDKIESVVRVAEYKRARGAGETLDDRLRGLYESQEVATNFKRRGAKTKELEGLWLYLNASIQSLDKLGRAFKDKKGATFGKIALSITGPALVLYAINRNDPNYQKLRDTEKDRFLHIPVGDGKFFRFPIPPELAPFANVPRRLLDQHLGGNEDAWNDVGKTLVETVIPPGISGAISGVVEGGIPGAIFGTFRGTPVVGPSIEAFANQTWLGSPIVPGYLEKSSPENQYNEKTSPLAIGLGKATNSSPMKLDYMLSSIGGDYGKMIQELSSKGRDEGLKSIGKSMVKRLVIDSEESNKLIDQFYELKNKYDTMYSDIKNTGKVPTGYNDETRKAINQVSDYLSEISTAIKQVQASNMSQSEKTSAMDKLKKARMDIAQRAYEQLKVTK